MQRNATMVKISQLIQNTKNESDIQVALKKEGSDFYSASVNNKYTTQVKKDSKGPWSTQASVKVDCNCADFMYRWAYVLNQNEGLIYPANYVDEPPKHKNPGMEVGACKHVNKVVKEILEREK